MLLLLALPFLTFSQVRNTNYRVHISDSPILFDSGNSVSDWEELRSNSSVQVGGKAYVLIQFSTIPSSSEKELLKEQGVNLLHYVPNYAWISEVDLSFDPNQLKELSIRSIVEIQSSWKVSKDLRSRNIPDHAQQEGGRVQGEVIFLKNLSEDEYETILEQFEMKRVRNGALTNSLIVEGEIDDFLRLAAYPLTQFVDFIEGPIQLEYESSIQTDVQNSRSTYISDNPPMNYFFDGTGVAAGIQEGNTVDTLQNPNFRSRINRTLETGTGVNGHKTNCARRLGSAGNLDPRNRGVAFGSEVYSGGLSGSNYANAISDSVQIISHSYGWGCSSNSTTYSGTSQNYDNLIRNNPSFMISFSAGNVGGSDCYAGVAGYGNVTGVQKMGKNMCIIGSVVHTDALAGFSSRGPAKDGRILPTVCSPGIGGTSYASPNFSGVFTILNHAYRYHNMGTIPNSGLLKSVIMNSADDMLNPGPDFMTGYGKVNARRAYDIIRLGQYEEADIAQGGINTHQINVPANVKQVKVMVYWVDWEAVAGITTRTIVNDLDIVLEDPGMQSYQPWVLNPTFGQVTLSDTAVRATDTLNNVEQVTILDPIPGTYELTVTGALVPQGPQQYFVSYDFIYDDIVVIHPHGSEKFVSGGEETIRWDAFGNTTSFDLLYSIDDGVTWDTIVSDLDSNMRHFDWVIPDHATDLARVKVIRDLNEGESGGPFTIFGQPEELELVWSCADSSLFIWEEQQNVQGYVVYKIVGDYMDSIAYTSSNSILLNGLSQTESEFISVAGYANGIIGRRMIALERPPADSNCVQNDAATVAMLSPNGQIPSCMTSNIPLKVEVKNPGVNTIDVAIPIAYQIDGASPVYDTILDTMPSGVSLEFTFATSPVLTGNHLIEVWTELPLESNFVNDTIRDSVFVYSGTSLSLPLVQDFDSFSNCGTGWTCEGENCLLQDGWTNLQNLVADDIDWRTDENGTGTANSGPSADHTTGFGKYLYLEGSTCYNKEAVLHGPCVDLVGTNQPTMSFWYHAYGSNIGQLHVDIIASGQLYEDVVEPVIGNQGDQWFNIEVDLSAFVGQQVVPVIRGSTGGGYYSDLAIDDINIYTSPLANYVASDTFICDYQNQVVTLSNASLNADTYEWNISPTSFTYEMGTNGTSFEPQIQFNASGMYTIELIATNGYGADTLIQTNYINVWNGTPDSLLLPDLSGSCDLVIDAPTTTDSCDGTVTGTTNDPTNFSVSGNYSINWEFTNSAGNSIVIAQNVVIAPIDVTTTVVNDVSLIANNTAADTYQWIDCLNGNAPIPGETGINFSPQANGEYAVIISQDGCTDTSACAVIDVIGLEDLLSEGIQLYPNPTSGNLTISYADEQGQVMVKITNALGQIVMAKEFVAIDEINLEIPGASGVYFVQVSDVKGTRSYRVVKKRDRLND